MPNVIDADAHVIECGDTWDFLEPAEQRFRPTPMEPTDGSPRKLWLIDGKVIPRGVGDTTIPIAIREMRDLPGRIAEMDRLEIAVQVVYPTLFLATTSDRPEVQVALARSYNRWLAEIAASSHGRLRWVVVPALASIEESLREIEFGRAHGACGVFLRGVEGTRLLSDPYLFPVYQRASDLDLPLCVHVGNGNIEMRDVLYGDPATRVQDLFFVANLPVLAAFHLLVTAGIPDQFPDLRVGFIEAGAQWVPYMIGEALRRAERLGTVGTISSPATLLADKRFYVSCRTDNDLRYLAEVAGRENFVMGTDYGHRDAASEIDAFQTLRSKGLLPEAVLDNVLEHNAARFYGIEI